MMAKANQIHFLLFVEFVNAQSSTQYPILTRRLRIPISFFTMSQSGTTIIQYES